MDYLMLPQCCGYYWNNMAGWYKPHSNWNQCGM